MTVLEIVDKLFNINVNNDLIIFIKVPFNVKLDSYKHYVSDSKIIFNKMSKESFQILKLKKAK